VLAVLCARTVRTSALQSCTLQATSTGGLPWRVLDMIR